MCIDKLETEIKKLVGKVINDLRYGNRFNEDYTKNLKNIYNDYSNSCVFIYECVDILKRVNMFDEEYTREYIEIQTIKLILSIVRPKKYVKGDF